MAHSIGTIPARASSAGDPISVSQAVLLGETVFCLMLKVNGSTNRAGGSPTWGPYTFTDSGLAVQKAATSPETSCELWYLLNPAPGTDTLTIPNTGGLTIFYQIAFGRAKAGGTSAFDGANGGNATSTNPTPGAIVTTTDGDIVFSVSASGATNFSPATFPNGTLISANDDGAHGGATGYILQSTLGSVTASFTFGTSDDWGCIAAAFKEIEPVSFNNYNNGVTVTGDGMCVGDRIR